MPVLCRSVVSNCTKQLRFLDSSPVLYFTNFHSESEIEEIMIKNVLQIRQKLRTKKIK